MKIAILSRSRNLHSIRRLFQEARTLGVECFAINPLDLQLLVNGKTHKLFFHGEELPFFDAVLPRIGTSITEYGIAVVRQFESQGSFVANSSGAIYESRDKFRALQRLSESGISVPLSVLSTGGKATRWISKQLQEMPAVIKLTQGTQGVGVMLAHSQSALTSLLDTFDGLSQPVLIQKYLKQSAGTDYRVFVVGGKIVATMQRTAPKGDFRSNIHRGGKGSWIKLPPSYERLALRAANAFNLGVAGVDLMDGEFGPCVLEVNSSPGFEGIEKATGKNIAGLILRYMVAKAKEHKRKHKTRRRKR